MSCTRCQLHTVRSREVSSSYVEVVGGAIGSSAGVQARHNSCSKATPPRRGPHELELYQLVLGVEVDIWDSRPIAARGESAIGAVRGKHAASARRAQDGLGKGEALLQSLELNPTSYKTYEKLNTHTDFAAAGPHDFFELVRVLMRLPTRLNTVTSIGMRVSFSFASTLVARSGNRGGSGHLARRCCRPCLQPRLHRRQSVNMTLFSTSNERWM